MSKNLKNKNDVTPLSKEAQPKSECTTIIVGENQTADGSHIFAVRRTLTLSALRTSS